MDLILWRHAEAEDGTPDLERRLTPRGHKHAARVAEWLLQRLPAKFAVLASPGARARRRPRRRSASRSRPCRALAPGASVQAILEAADWPERKSAVVVVGHQPDLGRVAVHLVAGAAGDGTIKKGGLWWLTNRVRDDETQVVVRAVVAPDLL